MTADAEKFLLNCITKQDVDTFDELRFIVYHEKYLEFDIDRCPTTSAYSARISVVLCMAPLCFSGKY